MACSCYKLATISAVCFTAPTWKWEEVKRTGVIAGSHLSQTAGQVCPSAIRLKWLAAIFLLPAWKLPHGAMSDRQFAP